MTPRSRNWCKRGQQLAQGGLDAVQHFQRLSRQALGYASAECADLPGRYFRRQFRTFARSFRGHGEYPHAVETRDEPPVGLNVKNQATQQQTACYVVVLWRNNTTRCENVSGSIALSLVTADLFRNRRQRAVFESKSVPPVASGRSRGR
jgi:hypothetical protein